MRSAIAFPVVQPPDPPPSKAEAPPLLLDKEDLGRELRVSGKTVDRLDAAGKLPRPVRIGPSGRAKRWPRQTIVAWIAAGCPDRATWERLPPAR